MNFGGLRQAAAVGIDPDQQAGSLRQRQGGLGRADVSPPCRERGELVQRATEDGPPGVWSAARRSRPIIWAHATPSAARPKSSSLTWARAVSPCRTCWYTSARVSGTPAQHSIAGRAAREGTSPTHRTERLSPGHRVPLPCSAFFLYETHEARG
jgi:hypothetical protein